MGFREQFEPAQWRALQFAPFLILSGISGRYSGFSIPELLVFERCLDEASRAPGELSREVLGPLSDDPFAFAAEFEGYDVTIVSGLSTVGEILVDQPAAEVQLFRDALVNVLGMGLARARGPYGLQPTVEGEQMVTMLDAFLSPGVAFPTEGDAA